MLIYNKIYSQQILNKRKGLLKRKGKRYTAMPFLFLFASKCFVNGFVERLLRVYITGCQCVILLLQQFNAFSPLNKSAGNMVEINVAIRRQVGRTSILPTDRESRCCWRKEKGNQCPPTSPPTPPQAFGKQKACGSLGRFLHAPLRSC